MSDEGLAFFCGVALGALVTVVLTGSFISSSYVDDAITAKVAHYEVDPLTGKTKFVYDCPNCNKD